MNSYMMLRWVLLKGSRIYWNDREVNHEKEGNMKKLQKGSSIEIAKVTHINTMQSNQFKLVLLNSKREDFVWQCASKSERDEWVKILGEYMRYNELGSKYDF